MVGGLKELSDRDLWRDLGAIHIPIRIVGGNTDGLVPFTLVEDQQHLMAHATVTKLWAGHGMFFEQIDALNRALAGAQTSPTLACPVYWCPIGRAIGDKG